MVVMGKGRRMRKTTSIYWKQISKKLKGVSKIILDMAIPLAVEAGIEKVCSIFNTKLHEMYRNIIINSIVTLGLNIIGMLIVFFNPFGMVVSGYIAAVCFLSSIVLFSVRIVRYFKKNGRDIINIGKSIIGKRSVSKGIEDYVYINFPIIAAVYSGINIVTCLLPSLKMVPSIQTTVSHMIHIFWKQLLLFVLVVLVYSVGIYWIVKPMLLKKYAGLNWYEVYFYPLYHLIFLLHRRT